MPCRPGRAMVLLSASSLTVLAPLPAAAQAPTPSPAAVSAPAAPQPPAPPLAPAPPASPALAFPSPALAVAPVTALPATTTPPLAMAPGAAAASPDMPPPAGVAAVIEPPARVGRIAVERATVSFHAPSETAWRPATPNLPVTTGDALWTEPGALAELQVSASTVALAPSTELDVAALDARVVAATQGLGETYVHLVAIQPGESWTLATPRGIVRLVRDGRYAVVAGDTASPTVVTVIEGSAAVSGAGVTVTVGPGQAATLTGTETMQASLGPAARDGFVTAILAEEAAARRAPSHVSLPAAVERMTGCGSLAQYGSWTSVPQYGAVWYPSVAAGWVPYREGRWAWVEPWGWTWVDDAPWGFAPFHYGRWVELSGRWGWVPLAPGVPEAAQPVYAPALVSFVAFATGAGLGFAAGEPGERTVGWVPLGPREPYLPAFHASSRYIQQVNVTSVNNVSVVQDAVARVGARGAGQPGEAGAGFATLANRGGATVVPAATMALSRPVAQAVQPLVAGTSPDGGGRGLPPGGRPVVGTAPVAPVAATTGMTPAAARALGMPVPAAGLASLHSAAPGPGRAKGTG